MRTHFSITFLASITCAALLASCGGSGEGSKTASTTEWGYIPLPDGNQLCYTAWLPEGKDPFPVLMMYDGYFGGSDPSRAANIFVYDMLAKVYAIVGVNLRGAACSSDSWELFNLQQAQDGAFAVDWLAERPWANGKVAMYGYSYAGIMQLWVASMRFKTT